MMHKVIYHDFMKKSNINPQDLTEHGTNSVELILKACVNAELFVGRIFKYNNFNKTLGPTFIAKVTSSFYGDASY
jgi:hypothetical protein